MQEALTDNRGNEEAPFTRFAHPYSRAHQVPRSEVRTRFGLRRPCPHQVLYFWCRCVQGEHPYPSRTRRLRPERPMVLHWRRCGRAGGRQIKKGDVAQLGEHLPCKQGVESSNLFISIARRPFLVNGLIAQLVRAHA